MKLSSIAKCRFVKRKASSLHSVILFGVRITNENANCGNLILFSCCCFSFSPKEMNEWRIFKNKTWVSPRPEIDVFHLIFLCVFNMMFVPSGKKLKWNNSIVVNPFERNNSMIHRSKLFRMQSKESTNLGSRFLAFGSIKTLLTKWDMECVIQLIQFVDCCSLFILWIEVAAMKNILLFTFH